MSNLQIEPLAFPEAQLLRWRQGNYDILTGLPASSFIRRILDEKVHNRSNPGRRFFGEAFVARHVDHEAGWYGSFKWLTAWPARQASSFGLEYRTALKESFPAVSDIAVRAFALRRHLAGKNPVPPDLWLVVGGEHRFIEVKLPGDSIRSTQIAGLALIATCLSDKNDVSAWIYNLYPEGGRADLVSADVQSVVSVKWWKSNEVITG